MAESNQIEGASGLSRSTSSLSGLNPKGVTVERDWDGLSVLVRVERVNGKALPVGSLTSGSVTGEVFSTVRIPPDSITILSDKEFLLDFPKGVIVSLEALRLQKKLVWDGHDVRIQCTIASRNVLVSIVREREINIARERSLEKDRADLEKENSQYKEQLVDLLERVNGQLAKLSEDRFESLQDVTGVDYSTPVATPVPSTSGPSLINTPPRFPLFSGGDPVPKEEASYAQWVFQVRGALTAYTITAVRTGMINSVRGEARELIGFIGFEAGIEEILKRLAERFSKVESIDRIQQEFYQLTQEKSEKVMQFAGRLERKFHQLREKVPERYKDSELRDRFFYGIQQKYRSSLRYLFDSNVDYAGLLEATRKAETEFNIENKTLVKKELVVTEPVVEVASDPNLEMKDQLKEISAIIKNMVFEKKGGESRGKFQKREGNDRKDKFRGRRDKRDKTETTGKRPMRCYRCGGFGHGSWECASQGKVDWRALNGVQSPPDNKEVPPEAPTPSSTSN